MLCENPNERITAADALKHSFFNDLKKEEYEKEMNSPQLTSTTEKAPKVRKIIKVWIRFENKIIYLWYLCIYYASQFSQKIIFVVDSKFVLVWYIFKVDIIKEHVDNKTES